MTGLLRVEHVMGTAVSIDVRDPIDPATIEPVLATVAADLQWVDRTFSTFRSDSEICRLGRGELTLDECDPAVREVLGRCEELREESQGAFDHRPTGRRVAIDPAGYVKGWSIDRVALTMTMAGLRHFSVNAGGDVLVHGGIEPGRPWRIGIRHPDHTHRSMLVLEADDLSVATSATYERGQHLWSPGGSSVAPPFRSVSVAGAALGECDAAAKVIWSLGPAGVAWAIERGFEVAVVQGEELLTSDGLAQWRVAAG
jgi:thiamine biosynthesis lipoprotein